MVTLRRQNKSNARPFVVLREPNTRLPLSHPIASVACLAYAATSRDGRTFQPG